jgi:hypothetical protein
MSVYKFLGKFYLLLFQCHFKTAHFVFLRSVRRLRVTASVVPSSPILVTLMNEAKFLRNVGSYKSTWPNIPKDAILHSHRRENPESYTRVYTLSIV